MTDSRHQLFLEAIQDNLEDDLPRLIYADWLEEQGSPRAEFIRVQCELTNRHFSVDELHHTDEETRKFWERSQQLENEYGADWRTELPQHYGIAWENFHRGFVNRVTCLNAETFLEHAEALFHATSLEEVAFLYPSQELLPELLESPWLEKMSHLDLSSLRTEGLASILQSRKLENLQSLNLTNSWAGDSSIFSQAQGIACQQLKTLNLDSYGLSQESFRELCRNPHFSELEELNLRRVYRVSGQLKQLTSSRVFPRLRKLGLGSLGLQDNDLVAMSRSRNLAPLEELDLRLGEFSEESLGQFLQSRNAESLKYLHLQGNKLTDEIVNTLIHSDRLKQLKGVNLSCNLLTDQAIHRLAESELPNQLRWLDLSYCDLTDTGVTLAESFPCTTHVAYQFQRSEPWKYANPGYRITVRGEEFNYIQAGRLPAGEQLVFDTPGPGGLMQTEGSLYDPTGEFLADYSIDWPEMKREPANSYDSYNRDEVFRHLFETTGFNPAPIRIFRRPDHYPCPVLMCVCSSLEEILEGPDRDYGGSGENWREEQNSWAREWIADQDFSHEDGGDRWHHDTGEFYSS